MLTSAFSHEPEAAPAFNRALQRATLWPAALSALALAALSVLALFLFRSAEMVDHADRVIARATAAEKYAVDMETGLRAFQLTGASDFLQPWDAARARIVSAFEALEKLVADNPAQSAAAAEARAHFSNWQAHADETLTRQRRGEDVRGVEWNARGKALFDAFREKSEQVVAEEEALRRARVRTLSRLQRGLLAAFCVAALGGVPLLVVALRRLVRRVSGKYERALSTARAQRDELHVTLRSIGDAVLATDGAGAVAFLNPEAERLTGWSDAEARGRSLAEVLPIFNEQTGEPAENPVERVLRERIVIGLANHTVLRPRAGGEIPIEDSAAPIFDADGAVRGVILVFHDVTEKHAREHALHESEAATRRQAAELQLIYDTAPVGLCSLDRELRWTRINARLAELNGFPVAAHLGRRVRELLPGVADGVEAACARIFATGEPVIEELIHEARAAAAGGDRVWRASYHAIRGAAGEITGIGIIAEDFSVRHRSAQELADRTRAAGLRADIAAQLVAETDLPCNLQGVCTLLAQHLDAAFVRIWTVDAAGGALLLRAGAGLHSRLDGPLARVPVGQFEIGRIAQSREPRLANDVPGDPRISEEEWAAREGMCAFAGCPLLAGGKMVGVLAIFAGHALSEALLAELAPLCENVARCIERSEAETELLAARERAESASHAAEEGAERFRLLAETVSLQVWTARPDGALDWANHHVASFFGAADLEREILGTGWTQFVHPEDLPNAGRRWRDAIASGERYETEFRLRGADGEFRWFLVRAEAMRDAAGAVVRWFGANTEIHELKLAQQSAEVAARAKDNFLAALSHELRTPLTPVLMTAAALREDLSLPAEARADLAMIERNIALEARLIDDLLDLTRIAKGKLTLREESCDAHTLIGLAVEIVRDEAQSKPVALSLDLSARHSGLRGDPARLQQVFWNLLRNAIKFTPSGGKVAIRTRDAEGDRLCVEVTDTGMGIAADALDAVFHPFEQADRQGDHRFGGLGLGLAIARAIVDLHGGSIRAESNGPGKGATFVVELPGAMDQATGASDPPVGGPHGSTPAERAEAEGAPPLRLLLIEDHEPTIAVLSRLLTRAGHQVVAAGSVAAAVAAAEAAKFDGVISDLGLPDGTGIDAIGKLRALQPGLPGIALSGYGMEDDLQRTHDAGFLTHLIKPVDFDQLRRALREFVPRPPEV